MFRTKRILAGKNSAKGATGKNNTKGNPIAGGNKINATAGRDNPIAGRANGAGPLRKIPPNGTDRNPKSPRPDQKDPMKAGTDAIDKLGPKGGEVHDRFFEAHNNFHPGHDGPVGIGILDVAEALVKSVPPAKPPKPTGPFP